MHRAGHTDAADDTDEALETLCVLMPRSSPLVPVSFFFSTQASFSLFRFGPLVGPIAPLPLGPCGENPPRAAGPQAGAALVPALSITLSNELGPPLAMSGPICSIARETAWARARSVSECGLIRWGAAPSASDLKQPRNPTRVPARCSPHPRARVGVPRAAA